MKGEPLFMALLSIPLLALIFVALNPYHGLLTKFPIGNDLARRKKALWSIGLFAFIFGLLTQMLGLYGAMESIRVWGEVEAQMLYDGLLISSIPAGYGLIIFIIGWLLSKSVQQPAPAAV